MAAVGCRPDLTPWCCPADFQVRTCGSAGHSSLLPCYLGSQGLGQPAWSYLDLAFGVNLGNVNSWPELQRQVCTYGTTDRQFFRRQSVSNSLSWYETIIWKMTLYWRSASVGWLQSGLLDFTFLEDLFRVLLIFVSQCPARVWKSCYAF